MDRLSQELLKPGPEVSVSIEQLDAALEEQSARACPVQHSASCTVTLDNKELWQEFHQHTNEMIITKAGRRMFPLIQLSLTGLDPGSLYYLLLALRVTDTRRWRFLNGEWTGSDPIVRGVASETTPTCSCIYVHPHSPSTGDDWLKLSPVSFAKLKLSNKDTDGGKVKLASLHRYQPVVYLVKSTPQQDPGSGDGCQAMSPPALEITEHLFEETQFIAVTAYQNEEITQVKIKHNPFAKAFLPSPDKPPAASPLMAPHPPAHPQYVGDPSEQIHYWPAGGYMSPPVHGQYYYSDGRYPPLFPDYYDTFAPVPYHS